MSHDVLIIGAGPAGATMAHLAARRGLKTRLVDKATFPRHKVCGSCLHHQAVKRLKEHDIELEKAFPGAPRLSSAIFQFGQSAHKFRLPEGGMALSRYQLDDWLVHCSEKSGAEVSTGLSVRATTPSNRGTTVHFDTGEVASARVVICATGLSAPPVPSTRRVRPNMFSNRIGIGAVVPDLYIGIGKGQILLDIVKGAYSGFVELEDGRIDIAASVDPRLIRESKGIASVMKKLLHPIKQLDGNVDGIDWRTTPLLTGHHSDVAPHPGIYIIGDAAGYVEPFSGEGMHWAIQSAIELLPIIEEQLQGRTSSDNAATKWREGYEKHINRKLRACRIASILLRKPALCQAALRLPPVRALSQKAFAS